jgi:hypothetical protein
MLPGEVPAGFVGLLEEGDPLALAILARFFALLKYRGAVVVEGDSRV